MADDGEKPTESVNAGLNNMRVLGNPANKLLILQAVSPTGLAIELQMTPEIAEKLADGLKKTATSVRSGIVVPGMMPPDKPLGGLGGQKH